MIQSNVAYAEMKKPRQRRFWDHVESVEITQINPYRELKPFHWEWDDGD